MSYEAGIQDVTEIQVRIIQWDLIPMYKRDIGCCGLQWLSCKNPFSPLKDTRSEEEIRDTTIQTCCFCPWLMIHLTSLILTDSIEIPIAMGQQRTRTIKRLIQTWWQTLEVKDSQAADPNKDTGRYFDELWLTGSASVFSNSRAGQTSFTDSALHIKMCLYSTRQQVTLTPKSSEGFGGRGGRRYSDEIITGNPCVNPCKTSVMLFCLP